MRCNFCDSLHLLTDCIGTVKLCLLDLQHVYGISLCFLQHSLFCRMC